MSRAATLPTIIQGGMGVAVSDWHLAYAVAAAGQVGSCWAGRQYL